MFHSFLSSLARSWYKPNPFFFLFIFILWSTRTTVCAWQHVFFFLFTNQRSTLLSGIWWSVGTSKFKRILCVSLWFLYCLVLWHINHYRPFNVKSSLYIHIKYIWFDFLCFYDISTIIGYLMLSPLYTYILNIYELVWLGFMAYRPL